MFKKSLAALALAGAFAGSAFAANVEVYGVVDTGLMYQHITSDIQEDQDTFAMESGINASSRVGLKGTEDLGNGLKVGFKLENGFDSDSGTLGNGDRLFGRESTISLYSDFGTFTFGRMGGVASSAGTYDLVYSIADAFDGFDNYVGGLQISDRYDNMIAYQSPEFYGVQMTAQYSLKTDSKDATQGQEGDSDADQYSAVALTGKWGNLQTVFAWEMQNYGNAGAVVAAEDTHTFYLGGNYDFGVTKLFGMVQYYQDAHTFANLGDFAPNQEFILGSDGSGIDGYGLHIGAITPVLGGNWTIGAYYNDAEFDAVSADDPAVDGTYYGISTRYEYPLSVRTSVYAGAGYAQTQFDNSKDGELDGDVTQVYMGLTHRF